MLRLKSYLAGTWQDGEGEGATLVNPSTGEPVATTSTAGLDFAKAFDHARMVGGPKLRSMTFAERGAVIKQLSKAIHDAREALIEVSMLNAGTTRGDSKFDIDGASGTLAYYASLGKKLGDSRFLVEGEGEQLTRSPRFYGYHAKLPRPGVAVHVNAFNFPAWGLAEKAAVALLAGMPVISKPATATALTTFRLMEVLVESGALPEGSLQLVCGGAGDLLSHLGPQDVLAFTGSADTGTHLRGLDNVLGRSVRVNVEADSLNSAVLGTDVEPGSETWNRFIRDVALEVTQKTGQKCTAIRRVFVPLSRIDAVQDAIVEAMGAVVWGDPSAEGVRMGPLATKQQLDDVTAGVEKLVAGGARQVWSSDASPVGAAEGQGYFYPPTLLRADEPRSAGAVHSIEVFGPVTTLMPYESLEGAGELVALGHGSLVTSIYSDDREALGLLVRAIAPWSGRVLVASKKIADQATAPGMVLPSCVHGGPGRAGGGEELGGLRGLDFYLQRTAVQGDRGLLERALDMR